MDGIEHSPNVELATLLWKETSCLNFVFSGTDQTLQYVRNQGNTGVTSRKRLRENFETNAALDSATTAAWDRHFRRYVRHHGAKMARWLASNASYT